ncbi:hypothetical protein SARC_04159 [Sphaeroforma arctica JP610]|uniref:HTH CENPB-type domain-containing protein n=1 Tax=Sphaeroforma arctica JP610 TaxID=667725 RepID=A0A0L0G470_9EUKA|nr:hypothetical protein SARC_04159 [Sphaeroforma arctica JP610]KNC83601.1 hypothetical protein SARC_04159 [Sphaeroforma arctica JP610]|eukprot:XP_014157503.1 hypothetical protein SARC_04159 [Sphaeroforma arctica JP610]
MADGNELDSLMNLNANEHDDDIPLSPLDGSDNGLGPTDDQDESSLPLPPGFPGLLHGHQPQGGVETEIDMQFRDLDYISQQSYDVGPAYDEDAMRLQVQVEGGQGQHIEHQSSHPQGQPLDIEHAHTYHEQQDHSHELQAQVHEIDQHMTTDLEGHQHGHDEHRQQHQHQQHQHQQRHDQHQHQHQHHEHMQHDQLSHQAEHAEHMQQDQHTHLPQDVHTLNSHMLRDESMQQSFGDLGSKAPVISEMHAQSELGGDQTQQAQQFQQHQTITQLQYSQAHTHEYHQQHQQQLQIQHEHLDQQQGREREMQSEIDMYQAQQTDPQGQQRQQQQQPQYAHEQRKEEQKQQQQQVESYQQHQAPNHHVEHQQQHDQQQGQPSLHQHQQHEQQHDQQHQQHNHLSQQQQIQLAQEALQLTVQNEGRIESFVQLTAHEHSQDLGVGGSTGAQYDSAALQDHSDATELIRKTQMQHMGSMHDQLLNFALPNTVESSGQQINHQHAAQAHLNEPALSAPGSNLELMPSLHASHNNVVQPPLEPMDSNASDIFDVGVGMSASAADHRPQDLSNQSVIQNSQLNRDQQQQQQQHQQQQGGYQEHDTLAHSQQPPDLQAQVHAQGPSQGLPHAQIQPQPNVHLQHPGPAPSHSASSVVVYDTATSVNPDFQAQSLLGDSYNQQAMEQHSHLQHPLQHQSMQFLPIAMPPPAPPVKPRAPKKKYVSLTMSQKQQLIADAEAQGFVVGSEISKQMCNQKELSQKYNVSAKTVFRALNQAGSIIIRSNTGKGTSRRQRRGKWPQLDAYMAEWVVQRRAKQPVVRISLNSIQNEAADYARLHGIDKFSASHGWVEGFKNRMGMKDLFSSDPQPYPQIPPATPAVPRANADNRQLALIAADATAHPSTAESQTSFVGTDAHASAHTHLLAFQQQAPYDYTQQQQQQPQAPLSYNQDGLENENNLQGLGSAQQSAPPQDQPHQYGQPHEPPEQYAHMQSYPTQQQYVQSPLEQPPQYTRAHMQTDETQPYVQPKSEHIQQLTQAPLEQPDQYRPPQTGETPQQQPPQSDPTPQSTSHPTTETQYTGPTSEGTQQYTQSHTDHTAQYVQAPSQQDSQPLSNDMLHQQQSTNLQQTQEGPQEEQHSQEGLQQTQYHTPLASDFYSAHDLRHQYTSPQMAEGAQPQDNYQAHDVPRQSMCTPDNAIESTMEVQQTLPNSQHEHHTPITERANFTLPDHQGKQSTYGVVNSAELESQMHNEVPATQVNEPLNTQQLPHLSHDQPHAEQLYYFVQAQPLTQQQEDHSQDKHLQQTDGQRGHEESMGQSDLQYDHLEHGRQQEQKLQEHYMAQQNGQVQEQSNITGQLLLQEEAGTAHSPQIEQQPEHRSPDQHCPDESQQEQLHNEFEFEARDHLQRVQGQESLQYTSDEPQYSAFADSHQDVSHLIDLHDQVTSLSGHSDDRNGMSEQQDQALRTPREPELSTPPLRQDYSLALALDGPV